MHPPRINFDEERHLYYTDDGVIVPSVTQIIKYFVPSFYVDNGAKELGTSVHKMLEWFDKGELVEEFYPEQQLVHLEHYKRFLRDMQPLEWSGIEERILSPDMLYSGTLDRFGYYKNKVDRILVDIKTGSSIPSWANLQTAAYAAAKFKDPENVARMVVQIHPKRLKNYKLKVYTDPDDFWKWRDICNQYHQIMRDQEMSMS